MRCAVESPCRLTFPSAPPSPDYNYTTEANSATGVTPKGWPRGHVVGGSSALNFLVVDAASEAEYNAWEELGNSGWNWASMNKYMKKSETFTTPSEADQKKLDIQVVPSDYGHNGPIHVKFPNYISKQVQNWIPALKTLGIPVNNQPLAGKNVGASVQPSDINPYNHTRSYSAPAYFYPNSARKNLALLANARVDKINWTASKKRCECELRRRTDVTVEEEHVTDTALARPSHSI